MSLDKSQSPMPVRSYYKAEQPKLRGESHFWAFLCYIAVSIYLLGAARDSSARLSLTIYLGSLLLVYGVSSTYHRTDWHSARSELIMQKVDHSSIFLLIAGTYTAVCLQCLPKTESWPLTILCTAWIIAIGGILKTLLWREPPRMLNVAFYFVSGLCIVPFIPKIFGALSWFQLLSFTSGGIIYLAGGLIYGFEAPDPIPAVFGYHEIFHLCTIAANICFIIPIVMCCC